MDEKFLRTSKVLRFVFSRSKVEMARFSNFNVPGSPQSTFAKVVLSNFYSGVMEGLHMEIEPLK